MDAAAGLSARVLLTVGNETDLGVVGPAPPNVRVERWVPQARVLGRASAVVCHGGSGTTLGALAAGLPLVVVPLFADQPLNARRVAEVGAGVAIAHDEPTPVRVDPAALRAAIERVLAEPAYAAAARAIADEMAALPPAVEAVAALT
jgi:MGT family glycosyltransferase